MRIWTLKLEREQEGYFRNFLGPSIEGPGPIEVVEKSAYDNLAARIKELEAELEIERNRLAGCGVAALSNTESTVAQRITKGNPYWSASYGDVCDAVDREMKYRAANEVMREALQGISYNELSNAGDRAKSGLAQAAEILETQTKEG